MKKLASRRYTNSQLKTQAMYTNILEQLEKAIALKEDGLKMESDSADRKKYLYDILDIKKETSNSLSS